jgi:anti-anti-sigma regulatory factor
MDLAHTLTLGGLFLYASVVTDGMMFLVPGTLTAALYVAFLGSISLSFLAQIYRFVRVSNSIQKQQPKWAVFGLSSMIIVLFSWTISVDIFPPSPERTRLFMNIVGGAIVYTMIFLYVLSFAIAILRYRLWNVDVLINRTLVYIALTASLALVYLVVVIGIQTVFRGITGQESDLAMVVSTLVIAVLFVPLRRNIQAVIDRRFYRKRYDAENALADAYTQAGVKGVKAVIFNFEKMEYMNSSGIGLLVTLLIRAQRQGQSPIAVGLNDHYQHTRLNEALQIFDSEDAAAASLG